MKLIFCVVAVFSLTASVASAQPNIRLAWDECAGSAAAATNKSWACDTNHVSQNKILVSSFVAPANLSAYVAVETVIKLVAASPTLPDWWKNGPTDCHNGYGLDAASELGLGDCPDPMAGGVASGYNWINSDGGPNRATVVSDVARSNSSTSLTAGTHYYAHGHIIKAIRTVGAGSCAGCTIPVTLVLDEVRLFQLQGTPPQDFYLLRNPAGQEAFVTWQGAPTATRRVTWGSIKRLYK